MDADARYSALAVEVARLPGAAERLFATHVDDGTGRCTLCSSGAQTGQYVWPCQLRLLAARAIEIRRGARPDPIRSQVDRPPGGAGVPPAAGTVGGRTTGWSGP